MHLYWMCTECQEKFQSSLKLLKHVTNHQHKDEEEVKIKDSDEVNKNKPTESIEAVNNAEKKRKGFIFSEFKFFLTNSFEKVLQLKIQHIEG